LTQINPHDSNGGAENGAAIFCASTLVVPRSTHCIERV